MRRREFLGAASGAWTLTSRIAGASPKIPKRVPERIVSLAGMPLEKLRDRYRNEFDEFLEFFDRYVVDREYGGFLCATDHDGSHFHTNKTATTEGRGIWCYSFLYNHRLARSDKYLDTARRSVDFLMKNRPAGTGYWPGTYARDGAVLDQNGSLPGDCYIAEGLAEFSRATGEKKYADLARETMFKCLARYDSPDFRDDASPYPGARNQWYWMLFMWFGTNWLGNKRDPELEKVVDRCVDALLNFHRNPDFDLWNLVINHDLTRPSGEHIAHAKLAGCGHATEATWMILYEAVRRNDQKLFDRAAGAFRRHVEVSRDDVYGGVFNDLVNVDENRWQLAKIFWAQAFVLIGTLAVIEHEGHEWAKAMFAGQFDYVETKCRLQRWGYPLMIDSADRKISDLPKASRKDIYHHPRYLMLCLSALDRMAARGGQISSVFA